jgi:hypothetical protein
MESIQCMVPQDSLLVSLAQQGAEAVGQIVVVKPSGQGLLKVHLGPLCGF